MLVGPVFTRELVTVPRRARLYVARTAYGTGLLVLMSTAWLVLTGTQVVRDVGEMARFGMILFQILAPLQLALAMFFSALFAAGAVAQEKDRRTLILLLMSRLSNSELVLGKLMASLLVVLVMLLAGLPLFMLSALFGGISFAQIGRVYLVTLASVLACGSLGSTLALWREKTFQTLALTALVLVLWLGFWAVVARDALGANWLGVPAATWAACFSPWEAILVASQPFLAADPALGALGTPVAGFAVAAAGFCVSINGLAIGRVRVWNPSRETQPREREEEGWRRGSIWGAEHDLAEEQKEQHGQAVADRPAAAAEPARPKPVRSRAVWDNPVIWREMRTWAYGRKVLAIKLVYLVLFAVTAVVLHGMIEGVRRPDPMGVATALVPLLLLSLGLVNAQAVTSLTAERDGRALDLLLVSDITPKEFVFGKLGGVFYNAKEMVLLPMLLCGYLWLTGALTLQNLVYLWGGMLVLYAFVAMLGVHAGMNYGSSRTAIAVSLGTLFFLFVGVATCIRIMIAFSGTFQAQLQPFLFFMLGGGIGLHIALRARNPSTAIAVASYLCPVATFYAITSVLLGSSLGVFIVVTAAYGFATLAMLVPAVYEFDVATGRTTAEE